MPKFKTRKEYEEWKAQTLRDDAKRPKDSTTNQIENSEASTEIKPTVVSPSYISKKTIGKWIILLSVVLVLVLSYILISKNFVSTNDITQKYNDSFNFIIQKAKQEKASVYEGDTINHRDSTSSTIIRDYKSWTEIIQKAKKSVVVIKTPNSIGSGFIISSDGTIITNSHVIKDSTEVEVVFESNKSTKATVIRKGTVPLDIAILKIPMVNFEYSKSDNLQLNNYDYLQLGDSNDCKEGEEVIAIGAPLALSQTITKGIISNCNRSLKDELQNINYIQTDASISPGNSGGPLINKQGEVIGMLTLKLVVMGAEGLNFAITSNVIKDFENGKLNLLEEAAKRLSEGNKEKIIYYSQRLKAAWINEYTVYYNKVSDMVAKRLWSVEQGTELLYRVSIPPSGFNSIPDWLESLAGRVLRGEMTEEQAYNLIKSVFVR